MTDFLLHFFEQWAPTIAAVMLSILTAIAIYLVRQIPAALRYVAAKLAAQDDDEKGSDDVAAKVLRTLATVAQDAIDEMFKGFSVNRLFFKKPKQK